jgi:hypothetical protein
MTTRKDSISSATMMPTSVGAGKTSKTLPEKPLNNGDIIYQVIPTN